MVVGGRREESRRPLRRLPPQSPGLGPCVQVEPTVLRDGRDADRDYGSRDWGWYLGRGRLGVWDVSPGDPSRKRGCFTGPRGVPDAGVGRWLGARLDSPGGLPRSPQARGPPTTHSPPHACVPQKGSPTLRTIFSFSGSPRSTPHVATRPLQAL